MRPIDFCTPKPFPLEHSCFSSLPSAAIDFPCRTFRRLPEDRSRSGTSRLRAHPRQRLLGALPRPSEDARSRHREARAARCRRDWGESRFTARFPLRRPVPTCGAAFSSASREGYRSPLTPLSPPPSSSTWAAFWGESHVLARRPPRPVPRGPRERRAHSRSGVSSIGSRCAHLARAEARTKPRLVHRSRRRSRDEDRRASMNRPPFTTRGPLRLRA